jgi:DNA adenine methylase
VLKHDFASLEKEISITLHNRKQHRQARVVDENPDVSDCVKRVWMVWTPAHGSYGCALESGFSYGRATDSYGKKSASKRANVSLDYATRLQRTQIEFCDALRIIRNHDRENAFFYCDLPYVGANQGRYDGYTQEDFDALLKLPESVKGTFLQSSYRNKALADFTRLNGWHTLEFGTTSSMARGKKVEMLTANYPIEGKP